MTGTVAVRGTRLAPSKLWLKAAVASLTVVIAAAILQPLSHELAAQLRSKADPSLETAARQAPHSVVPVIVRETVPDTDQAEKLVRQVGGTVTRELQIIGGFAARIPADSIGRLARSDAIWRVWADGRIRVNQVDMSQYDGYSPNLVWRDTIRLPELNVKYDGTGVTVAVLDTGITNSPDFGSRILAKVDFTPDHDGIDRFGHGTHMAGIIAGNGSLSGGLYTGVAPAANLVSVKVAGADGSTDVSVVIGGMQWVYSHKATYNIRVMNLSFGTDSRQSYLLDPLDYAVEQLWFSGIMVVASAGNRGNAPGTINKPGDDPFIITVGASTNFNTPEPSDDTAASFSSRGPTQDGFAKPDLVAPGISIASVRAPGSTIDVNHPLARVGEYYFKGTGTSQSTAIVSGVLARLVEAKPSLTPDLAKNILIKAAYKYLESLSGAGKGEADSKAAYDLMAGGINTPANVGLAASTGLGSLELARGSYHVYADLPFDGLGAFDLDGMTDLVSGEIDPLGNTWSGNTWSGNTWSGNTWSGNTWSSYVFEGNTWSGNTWSGNTWSGNTWSGNTWSGNTWSGNTWSGNTWSGNTWS